VIAFSEAWSDTAIGQPPIGLLPWAHPKSPPQAYAPNRTCAKLRTLEVEFARLISAVEGMP